MNLFLRLLTLLALLVAAQLSSCTTAQPWRGFSGPAYLPARPTSPLSPRPHAPVAAPATRPAAR